MSKSTGARWYVTSSRNHLRQKNHSHSEEMGGKQIEEGETNSCQKGRERKSLLQGSVPEKRAAANVPIEHEKRRKGTRRAIEGNALSQAVHPYCSRRWERGRARRGFPQKVSCPSVRWKGGGKKRMKKNDRALGKSEESLSKEQQAYGKSKHPE